jgi:predicted nucleic acid-binding protein
MNGNKMVIDTNIALYLLDGDEILKEYLEDKAFYLFSITELELLGFKGITETEETAIEFFLEECSIVDMNRGIKDITIDLRRNYKLKLPDAIIAATAIFLGIPLISADGHFDKIEDLVFIKYQP